MNAFVRSLNTLHILILCGVVGGALYVQFALHETPCPLCLLQRVGMMGVAVGCALNLRFGVQPRFYAVSMFSAIFGGSVSLRQIVLHIKPGDPGFGDPVLGMHLYTWAFVVFACSLLGTALLLLFHPSKIDEEDNQMTLWEKFVVLILFAIIATNVWISYDLCQFGPCAD